MWGQNKNKNKMYQVYGAKKKILNVKLPSDKPWPAIIGCTAFAIICILITLIAVLYRNSMDESQRQQASAKKIKQEMEQMSITKLSERYKPNDIDTIYSIEHIGPNRDNFLEQDENTTKLTIKYMVIKGLKDKDIESDINSKISREMSKLYKNSEVNDDSIDYINISGNIVGNYSNVVSINLIKYIKENSSMPGKKHGKSINIDLSTGKDIKFDELFLPGVSIKTVLSQVIYDNIAQKNETLNIEEKVYDLLSKYEQGEIKEFYFDSSKINFVLDGNWYSFPMWKYYDKIGIYKRFITDNSIFDGTHQKTEENFVFQPIKEELINSKISNNFIAIIITPYNLKNKSSYFIKKFDEYYDKVEKKIQDLKKEAQTDTKQTLIYACKIDLNDIDNYWGYFPTGQDISIEKKTNLLDEFEICEAASNECIIRVLNEYFEKDLLNKMYSRNYTLEKFVNMSKEELFALVGNKAKLESSSEDKTIIELVKNTPVEETIENQFKKSTDEIKELLPKIVQDEELNKLKIKLKDFKDNLEILEGKFAGQENEKIKSIDENYKKELENIENSIYNINLKREITEIFESEITKLDSEKNENNMADTEERAYYLLQRLNSYYTRNKNNDNEINKQISDYSKVLMDIQEWAIKLRQKKKEEAERQNEIRNNITNTTNTTNSSNTTNRTNTNNTNNTTNNTNNTNNTNVTNNPDQINYNQVYETYNYLLNFNDNIIVL